MVEELIKAGVYRTVYGNACYYGKGEYWLEDGDEAAYDLDMGKEIPLEMVDFNDYLREQL